MGRVERPPGGVPFGAEQFAREFTFNEARSSGVVQHVLIEDINSVALHLRDISQFPVESANNKLWAIRVSRAQFSLKTLEEIAQSSLAGPRQVLQINEVLFNKRAKFLRDEFDALYKSRIKKPSGNNRVARAEEKFFEGNERRVQFIASHLTAVAQGENKRAAKSSLQKMIDHNVRVVKKGLGASENFFNANTALAFKRAKEIYDKTGAMSLLDLCQFAYLGLWQSVARYDWRTGYEFSTYAGYLINGAISEGIRESNGLINLPAETYQRLVKFRRENQDASQDRGEVVGDDGLIKLAGPDGVLSAAIASRRLISTDKFRDEEDKHIREFGESVADDRVDMDREIQLSQLKIAVRSALAKIMPREREVLSLRYGVTDGVERDLSQVGGHFGIKREMTRRVEQEALKKLRESSIFQILQSFKDEDPKAIPTSGASEIQVRPSKIRTQNLTLETA